MDPRDPMEQPGAAAETEADAQEIADRYSQEAVIPADVTPGPTRLAKEQGDWPDQLMERGPAIPGLGGSERPPEEVGRTPTVHRKRPLATKPREPEIGKWPVPRTEEPPE